MWNSRTVGDAPRMSGGRGEGLQPHPVSPGDCLSIILRRAPQAPRRFLGGRSAAPYRLRRSVSGSSLAKLRAVVIPKASAFPAIGVAPGS